MLDNLDRHLSASNSFDTAAIPIGLYFAWCANLGLLNPAFERKHEAVLVRMKMRDMRGSELFVITCGGDFLVNCLNEKGQEFSRRYYDRYLEDLRSHIGDIYAVTDEWQAYDQIAPVLTRALMGAPAQQPSRGAVASSVVSGSFPRFWRRR